MNVPIGKLMMNVYTEPRARHCALRIISQKPIKEGRRDELGARSFFLRSTNRKPRQRQRQQQQQPWGGDDTSTSPSTYGRPREGGGPTRPTGSATQGSRSSASDWRSSRSPVFPPNGSAGRSLRLSTSLPRGGASTRRRTTLLCRRHNLNDRGLHLFSLTCLSCCVLLF